MTFKFLFLLFLGGLIVLVSFLFGKYFGLISITGWWVANALHFIGGVYAFFFIKFVFNSTRKYHKIETALLMKVAIFSSGALVLGVLWEWYEFIFIFKFGTLILEAKGISVYFDTMFEIGRAHV